MKPAAEILAQFDIPHEMRVVSAHRSPAATFEYAGEARARGLKVIIAGAGGAAHLPGVVAALTPLPVIGVPMRTQALSGVDSLYSIVQMPAGIPVATVGIDNSRNAGLLAVRILAIDNPSLTERLEAFRKNQETLVAEMNRDLSE
jgi:phosphoribosylaminoimidazole carboxylase PurE protein